MAASVYKYKYTHIQLVVVDAYHLGQVLQEMMFKT